MAKILKPTLFSEYFSISPDLLADHGLINPFLDVDTQLFIDPVLLGKSQNPSIANDAYNAFRSHFQNFVRLLKISRREGDAA